MTGRTVVVTGSASGIGAAVVDRLVRAGNRVIGVDLRNADIVADLAAPDGIAAMARAVTDRADGRIDAIVANAGVIGPIELCFAVNYRGVIGTLEALRPALARAPSPRVAVTVSMAAGLNAIAGHAEALERGETPAVANDGEAYTASKLAIARWIRRSASDAAWGRAGILVNGLCPGIVDTPMGRDSLSNPLAAQLIPMTPLARLARAEEMAAILAFLIGADNSYMARQLIFADGLNAALRPDFV